MQIKTLRDVSLRNYQTLQQIKNPSNEDVLTILFEYSIEEIRDMKQKDLDALAIHIKSLFEKENDLCNILQINDTEFGFIPKLDDITYGENTDVSSYINDWETMHKAMAVLYRPITAKMGNRYSIAKYEGTDKYAELMKDAPLDVVLSMIVFFYNLTNELLNCIPSYLQKTTLRKELLAHTSKENGEDIANFTLSLKGICEDLTKLQNYPYLNV